MRNRYAPPLPVPRLVPCLQYYELIAGYMNQPLLLRSTTDHERCCMALPVLTAAVNFPRLQLFVRVPVRTPLTTGTNSSTGATSETLVRNTNVRRVKKVCA